MADKQKCGNVSVLKKLLGVQLTAGFVKNLAGLYVLNLGNIATNININISAGVNLKNAAD